MAQRGKVSFRGSEMEAATWERCAEASGLKLSAWLRRAANQTAELEASLEVVTSKMRSVLEAPPTVEQVRDKMYPQRKKKCVHRLMPGTYCKRCETTK